jgi:hypothetical protein
MGIAAVVEYSARPLLLQAAAFSGIVTALGHHADLGHDVSIG